MASEIQKILWNLKNNPLFFIKNQLWIKTKTRKLVRSYDFFIAQANIMAKVAGAVSVKGSLKTAIITFNQKDGQLLDAQYFTDEGGARKWQDF